MSGWFYLKEGMFDDAEIGPLTDAAFLQMAFDGTLKPKSKVKHDTHTRGQLAFLEQIPAAKKKYEEGHAARAEMAAQEAAAKEAAKRAKAEEKESAKRQREDMRRLSVVPPAPPPIPAQILPPVDAPFAGTVAQPPQPVAVLVSTHNPNYQQLSSAGWFTRALGSTLGVITAIAAVVLGIPLLLCAGCFVMSLGLSSASSTGTPPSTITPASSPTTPTSAPEGIDTTDMPATLGVVRVTVSKAYVGKVQLKSFSGTGESEDELLQIDVVIENTDSSRKLDFRGWGAGSIGVTLHGASLSDDIGNSYKRVTFGVTDVVGQIDSESIYPGKSVTDKFVFESPVAGAKKLIIELPGKAFSPSLPDGQLLISWPRTN